MRASRVTIAFAITVCAALPASAQRWGSVELGAFGQYTNFGNVLQLDNKVGFGGMAGLFILPNLAAEADISILSTSGPLAGDIKYRPWHARVAYHVPLTEQLKLALGLGYTQGIYDGDPTPNQYEDAAGALVGLKYYFKPSWAFNAEVLLDKFPSPGDQPQPIDKNGYWNNSFRAGVNWLYPSLQKCTVAIDPTSATIAQGDSRTFTATARDDRTGRPCSGTVTFASTDNSISPNGMYTARTPGNATVTASYKGRGGRSTASANVTVNRPAPPAPTPAPTPLPAGPCLSSIDVRPDTATVLRGETVQFTTSARTCAGGDTTVSVTYTGGNVDPSGRFTAGNDTGVVQITATANVGGRALTDVANIRVVRLRSTVVNFDLNSAVLDGGARSRLDQLITALRANPRVTIRVEVFELAMNEEEQVRWVCGGRAEPVTRATKGAP